MATASIFRIEELAQQAKKQAPKCNIIWPLTTSPSKELFIAFFNWKLLLVSVANIT
jgi:hypothetical protein